MEIFNSAEDLRVIVRTASRVVLDTPAKELEVEDARGRFTLTADSVATMVALVPSEVVMRKRDGSEIRAHVSWGSLTAVGRQVRLIVRNARLDRLAAPPSSRSMPIAV